MYIMLSVVIPGEVIVKAISMKVDGMVKDLDAETWLVLGNDGRVAKDIDAGVDNSPVRSSELLTTLPEMPTADEVVVAAKLMHLTV